MEDADNPPAFGGLLSVDTDVSSFEQNLQIKFDYGDVEGVLGACVTNIEETLFAGFEAPAAGFLPGLPPGILLSRDEGTDIKTTNFAFFGEVEARPIPKPGVIAGPRYDRESIEQDSAQVTSSNGTLPPPFDTQPGTSVNLGQDTTLDAFLPKDGLVYDWTDDLSTGLTAQREYRAGGTQINGLTGELAEFGPEFTWNFELSLRSHWLDERPTLNANAFCMRWRDIQVNVQPELPFPDPANFRVENAGAARVFGGGLEIRARPIDQLDPFASVGVADTAFKDFIVDAGLPTERDLARLEFPQAQKFSAAFGGSYDFDNGIELHGDASYTDGSVFSVHDPDGSSVDRRFLVNARVEYQEDNWRVGFYARNLFDEDFLCERFTETAGRSDEPLPFGPRRDRPDQWRPRSPGQQTFGDLIGPHLRRGAVKIVWAARDPARPETGEHRRFKFDSRGDT
ncbi:MAG: TonB-dependent receptor [Pseudomonadota bacterium]